MTKANTWADVAGICSHLSALSALRQMRHEGEWWLPIPVMEVISYLL